MASPVNQKLLKQQTDLLKDSYLDATRKDGLIDFTIQVHTGKYSVKQADLDNLFTKTVWIDQKVKGGHRKLENAVTKIVVEYSNHAKDIDPGAAETILNQVQEHLNILCNEIFRYEKDNWKVDPDYGVSVERWLKWKKG